MSTSGTDAGLGGARLVFSAGVLVALGAGVVTAHGLFEVAVASTVPGQVAWLYPVITDGLALVAYAATTRLHGHARRYAWFVVVLAAGMSGLAQATYLAGGASGVGLSMPPAQLRFGVGAWPAIAAAIAAHLLFLIGTTRRHTEPAEVRQEAAEVDSGSDADQCRRALPAVQPGVQPHGRPSVQPGVQEPTPQGVQLDTTAAAASDSGEESDDTTRSPGMRPMLAPRDRAVAVAVLWRRRHGDWPSARELAADASIGKSTAATVLQELRTQPPGQAGQLHLITDEPTRRAES